MEQNRLCQVVAALKRQLQRHADAAVPYPAPFYRPSGRKVNETFRSVETCSVVHAMTAKPTLCLEAGIQGRFAERPGFAPGHLFDY
jgi:hypothetical protein